MMFHKHKWVEIERFYSKPVEGISRVKNCEPVIFQQLTQGFTTIRYKCDRCDKWKITEVLGKSMKELT